jgi:hypothetical protein
VWKEELALFKGPMKDLVAKGDLDRYIEQYERLRRRIIECAGNPVLAEMLDTIYEKTQVLIRRIIILPGRAETGRKQHVAMLEAMVRGEGARGRAPCAARDCATPRPRSRNTSATSSRHGQARRPHDERRQRIEADFAQREAKAKAMGGPEKLAKRAKPGILNARERLDLPLRPGHLRGVGLFTTSANPPDREKSPSDGKIAGFGKIAGREAAAVSNDFTVMGARAARRTAGRSRT